MPGQEAEHPGPQISAPGLADVIAEQVQPMLLVASLGVGQREQDVAFLARPPLRETAIYLGLGAFVGQMLAPATQISGSRLAFDVHAGIIARTDVKGTDTPSVRCPFVISR